MKRTAKMQINRCPKRKFLCFAFCLLLNLNVIVSGFAQEPLRCNLKYLHQGSILFGIETASTGMTYWDPITYDKETFRLFEFGPKLGVFLNEKWCVGGMGYWGTVYGTLVEDFTYSGYGGFIRYYPFSALRKELLEGAPVYLLRKERLQKKRDRSFLGRNLFPYVDGSFRHMNIPPVSPASMIQFAPNLENAIRVYGGLVFRVFRGLSIDTGLGLEYWKDGLGIRLGAPLAIHYYLPTSRKYQ